MYVAFFIRYNQLVLVINLKFLPNQLMYVLWYDIDLIFYLFIPLFFFFRYFSIIFFFFSLGMFVHQAFFFIFLGGICLYWCKHTANPGSNFHTWGL